MRKPESGFKRIVKNVGAAVVAAGLQATFPGNVLAQTKVDPVETQTEIKSQIDYFLKQAKQKDIVEETQKVLEDPKFISGVEFLIKRGVRIPEIVGEVHPKAIIDIAVKLPAQNISDTFFDYPGVMNGFLELIKNGVEVKHILPYDGRKVDVVSELQQAISDSEVRNVYLKMLSYGYKQYDIKITDILTWAHEVYSHPNFEKNARLLSGIIKNVREFNFREFTKIFNIDNIEAFIGELPQNVGELPYVINQMCSYINEIYGNEKALRITSDLFRKYPKNLGIVLFELSLTDLFDEKYLNFVINKWEKGVIGQGSVKTLRDITQTYVETEINQKYYELKNDLNTFVQIYLDQNTSPVVRDFLEQERKKAFTGPILTMNKLHDDGAKKRLEVIKNYSSLVLLGVILSGGSDAYLSTFRLIYNGNGETSPNLLKMTFLEKVKSDPNFGSLYGLIKKIRLSAENLGRLIQFTSQNDLLDTFLKDVGNSEQQQEILNFYLFNLENNLTNLNVAVVNDLYHITTNKEIKNLILNSFKKTLEEKKNLPEKTLKIIKFLITSFLKDSIEVPEWAREIVEKYKDYFPKTEILEENQVFNAEKVNKQLHTYYNDVKDGKSEDDWDGHQSFKDFMISLGGNVTWDRKTGKILKVFVNEKKYSLEDKGDYVIIKQKFKSGREIEMFVIKPDNTDQQVEELGKMVMKTEKPQIVQHGGHSFHSTKTISLLTPDVKFVNLRSCGGANEIADVLKRSPGAQVLATKRVGTMNVNRRVVEEINTLLGSEGRVPWKSLRDKLESEFRHGDKVTYERWRSYILPDENRTAHLFYAIDKVIH